MTTSTCRPSSSNPRSGYAPSGDSRFPVLALRARWLFTDKQHGDFGSAVDLVTLRERCRTLVDAPWTLLDQVHGADVVRVGSPGDCSGSMADAAVTRSVGAVLAVRTADCGGVVLVGSNHSGETVAVGVAHAGWHGLEEGILHNTVASMKDLGSSVVRWQLGPCISAEHYEFGEEDLERLVHRYGESLRGVTGAGAPALDLRAGIVAAMDEAGAEPLSDPVGHSGPACTAVDARYYSWRARTETGRQVTAVWMETEDHADFGPLDQRTGDPAN